MRPPRGSRRWSDREVTELEHRLLLRPRDVMRAVFAFPFLFKIKANFPDQKFETVLPTFENTESNNFINLKTK